MAEKKLITETPSQMDWARLAAYIDSEGGIELRRSTKSKYFRLAVKVVNTDARLPLWCRSIFGGGKIAVVKRTRVHPLFNWAVVARRAQWVLENCLPYFIIKREQAEVALAYYATVGRKGQRVKPEALFARAAAADRIRFLKKNPAGQLPVIQ